MATSMRRRLGFISLVCVLLGAGATSARADEIWVAPTAQADFGGLGIGSNVFWPATGFGVVRLAWAVPNNLLTFQSAKLALIPHTPAGAGTLNLFVCRAQNSDLVGAACTGPLPHAFTGVTNRLLEVDVSAAIGAQVGAAGLNYLAVSGLHDADDGDRPHRRAPLRLCARDTDGRGHARREHVQRDADGTGVCRRRRGVDEREREPARWPGFHGLCGRRPRARCVAGDRTRRGLGTQHVHRHAGDQHREPRSRHLDGHDRQHHEERRSVFCTTSVSPTSSWARAPGT